MPLNVLFHFCAINRNECVILTPLMKTIGRLLAFGWPILLHWTCWKMHLWGKEFSLTILKLLGANSTVKVLSKLDSLCCWLRKWTR